MKHEKFLSALWTWVISACLAVGAAGCLTTAFEMTFTPAMLAATMLFCGILTICGTFRRSWWICLGAVGLTLGLFWQKLQLPLQLEALVYHITDYYDRAYGWGAVSWSSETLSAVPKDGILTAIGCLVGLAVSFTLSRGITCIPAAAAAIGPLAACVVVTDTVPETHYLFAFLLGFILLLMTQSLRRRNRAQSSRLAAILFLPLALALVLLFTLIPQEGYTPPPGDLAQQIEDWLMGLQAAEPIQQITEAFTGQTGRSIDLKYVGPKSRSLMVVMEVTSYETGSLYLRGQAYDTYDGTAWSQSTGDWAMDDDFVSASVPRGDIRILTRTTHDVLYTPYNSGPELLERMEQGQIDNDGIRDYTVTQWNPVKSITVFTSGAFPRLDEEAMAQYLQLPAQTQKSALEYLRARLGFTSVDDFVQHTTPATDVSGDIFYGITLDDALLTDEYFELANAIADHVRSSAYYDLRTARMPSEEEDFALWFLEDSETGYCVHFATAAAVLLRAAGVPCRYVTGYLAETVADEAVNVQGGDAHAWVEFWVPGCGWQLLDATGSPAPEETEPSKTTTAAPTETEPEETETLPEITHPSIPNNGGETPETPSPDLSGLWKTLKILLLTAGMVLLILAQRILRLCLREKRRKKGSSKEQALFLWRETEFLSRLLSREPPQELRELARKAKFSQHCLSDEELGRFDLFRADALRTLGYLQWYRQILYRLVLALY